MFVIAFTGYRIYEIQTKSIVLNYSSIELVGVAYEEASHNLAENGFTNLKLVPRNDVDSHNTEMLNTVYKIEIGHRDSFEQGLKIPYDTLIKISYHSPKLISMPRSSKEYKNEYYQRVYSELEDAGFMNIKTEPVKDLIFGLLNRENTIFQIIIDGKTEFDKNDVYPSDAEIELLYHTFMN